MARLIVRKVEAEVVAELRRRAARSGRCMEAEHREILRAALRSRRATTRLKDLLLEMPGIGTDADLRRQPLRSRRFRF
jgi:plasmid stability protein